MSILAVGEHSGRLDSILVKKSALGRIYYHHKIACRSFIAYFATMELREFTPGDFVGFKVEHRDHDECTYHHVVNMWVKQ